MPPVPAHPVNKIPASKLTASKARVNALINAADFAAGQVGGQLAGGINPTTVDAAYAGAYDAAIANGATVFEADTIAKAAVAAYILAIKLGFTPAQAQVKAAIAGLSALAAAVAAMSDPCNLGGDTGAVAAACMTAVDALSVPVALQYLIDNNG